VIVLIDQDESKGLKVAGKRAHDLAEKL